MENVERSEFENQLFGPSGPPDEYEQIDDPLLDVENIQAFDYEPSKTKWDQARHAADTQRALTYRLIWVLIGAICAGVGLLASSRWTHLSAQQVSSFFSLLFGSIVTLVTAATSFWFGTQHKAKQD